MEHIRGLIFHISKLDMLGVGVSVSNLEILDYAYAEQHIRAGGTSPSLKPTELSSTAIPSHMGLY